MLIKSADLEHIRAGRVDLVFRRWTRPTVKAGGTLMTALGVLAIEAVDAIGADDVSDEDAWRAGFDDAAALWRWLDQGKPGVLYRIRVRYVGADPRIDLRDSLDDFAALELALAKLDGAAPWTVLVLALIAAHPGRLAQALADELGLERPGFKAKVRQLKALGLTESLETGYRLSPRGVAWLERGK